MNIGGVHLHSKHLGRTVMSPIEFHAYCILRVLLNVICNVIYFADRLFTCLSVRPCVIISVVSFVYLSKCHSICLAFPPPSPICSTESLSFGIVPLVPLPICFHIGVHLFLLRSFPHPPVLPSIWFMSIYYSNPSSRPLICFQFHLFFTPQYPSPSIPPPIYF